MMQSGKLSLLLWMLIMVTAFGVIKSSHQSRQLFIQWQGLIRQAQEYDVEWSQLLLEKSTMQSYIGLEKVAREELQMVFPARKQIVIVPGDKP